MSADNTGMSMITADLPIASIPLNAIYAEVAIIMATKNVTLVSGNITEPVKIPNLTDVIIPKYR